LDPVFAVAALASVASGLLVVTRRNPVYSAIWLLACFLAFAVVYLKLEAPFLAAMHVLVYTGAILVLFLFVIMLLNLKPEELGTEISRPRKAALGALSAGLFAALAVPMWRDPRLDVRVDGVEAGAGYGSAAEVGRLLFTGYALPFELVSVLVLVAVFGGVVAAKKRL
jgi:NADH-quinone oxidoreductase subunit J